MPAYDKPFEIVLLVNLKDPAEPPSFLCFPSKNTWDDMEGPAEDI